MKMPWHHSPIHLFTPGMIYMVTAGTMLKEHFFKGSDRLEFLQDTLLQTLELHGWIVQAWAVFVNHYHFIARAPMLGVSISGLIQEIHSISAIEVNRLDGIHERQVWFQYWDKMLTYEKSWLVRLNYVNNNAVHHQLVRTATDYPYCSAAWFEREVNPGFCRKVKSFRYDKLKVVDTF
jgi:putative transposase